MQAFGFAGYSNEHSVSKLSDNNFIKLPGASRDSMGEWLIVICSPRAHSSKTACPALIIAK